VKQKAKAIAKTVLRVAMVVSIIMLLENLANRCDSNLEEEPFENCVNACLVAVESSYLTDEWSISYRKMACAEFCYKEYMTESDFEKKYSKRR